MRVSCSTLPEFLNTIPFYLFIYLNLEHFSTLIPIAKYNKS